MTEIAEDKALMQRITQGDKTAMRTLYDAHADALYRFIRTVGLEEAEASDILHDVMLEAWRRAERFEGRSSVRGWLFGMARFKAIDRIRRATRSPVSEPDETQPDESPDALAIVAASEDANRVRACIEKLSAAHKSAIHLAFYQELPYEEIAEIEGCPLGTVKTRIFSAKKLLKHCLSREDQNID